ncbi:MAG: plasmid replication protein RepC [Yoonia sp.]
MTPLQVAQINATVPPNRKRFARSRGGEITAAFGFDLSPMVYQAETIRHAATEATWRAERLQMLRDEVLTLRAEVMRQTDHESQIAEVSKLLRSKADEAALQAMAQTLRNLLKSDEEELRQTEKLSAACAQNERHIQDSDIIHFDPEGQGARTHDRSQPAGSKEAEKDQGVTLGQVLSTCKEHQSPFPETLRNWSDVERLSDKIAPMLGIDQPVIIDAKRIMGREAAAITVLCMLEKANAIRSPGAYLRRLTQMARDGVFSLQPMLMALVNREIVSRQFLICMDYSILRFTRPDNHANCRLYDQWLGIQAASTPLRCDVRMEYTRTGAHQRFIASSILRIPLLRVSLYRVARGGAFNILRPEQE